MPRGITNFQGIVGIRRLITATITRNKKPTPHTIRANNMEGILVIAKSASGFENPQLTIESTKTNILKLMYEPFRFVQSKR
jgi:hypothetical protein